MGFSPGSYSHNYLCKIFNSVETFLFPGQIQNIFVELTFNESIFKHHATEHLLTCKQFREYYMQRFPWFVPDQFLHDCMFSPSKKHVTVSSTLRNSAHSF